MKTLLLCALLTLTAAKPRQGNPWQTEAPVPEGRWGCSILHWCRDPPVPVDDDFMATNPRVTDDGRELFEADLVLTDEQRDSRQATERLWTSPVSFAISAASEPDRAAILAGIQYWRDKTCVQFTEVAEGSTVPHINFIRGSGCWSSVGQGVTSGGQSLSIGSGCSSLATVVHEISHAMGLWHQQSRDDRDTYVTIMWENIAPGAEFNFKMMTGTNNYSVPYDLTSRMHYSSTLFTKNGLETIRTKNFLQIGLIGQRSKPMSHRDQHIANLMYKCAASCSSPPTCQNGGFVGEDCTCVCPHNTDGANCETLKGSYYGDIDCGDIDMTTEGTITSPNYPNNFPKNVVCWWIINAPAGQRVKLSVTDMKMLWRSDQGRCQWDHLGLRYTGNVYEDDVRACDEELTGKSFTSTGTQFIVQFWSSGYGWHRGFSADVTFVSQ